MQAPYTILACCGLALGTLYALRARASRLHTLRRVVTPPEELLLIRQGLRLAKTVFRQVAPSPDDQAELIRKPESITIFAPGPALVAPAQPVVDALVDRQPVPSTLPIYTFNGDTSQLQTYTLDVPGTTDQPEQEPHAAAVSEPSTGAPGEGRERARLAGPLALRDEDVVPTKTPEAAPTFSTHEIPTAPTDDPIPPIVFHLPPVEPIDPVQEEDQAPAPVLQTQSARLPLAAMHIDVHEPAARAPMPVAQPPINTHTPPPPPSQETRDPHAPPEWNLIHLDYRDPMPWPKVRGPIIDFHCHLFAARHAKAWFETARHYGIDCFVSMTPLEEVAGLLRDWPGRLHFIAVPQWYYEGADFISDFLRRIEMFYNLGSRIVKFHVAPQTIVRRGPLDDPKYQPVFREIQARGMMVMTHVGDPQTWYDSKYADTARYGQRDQHYDMWERVMQAHPDLPWVGAHLGGNPEDLQRLQSLLDRYPNLNLDCSATRWIAREISRRRDEAREFFIKNADRILFGSDQVSGDDRGFDFLASRWWVHRKLWDTAYIGPNPILDPDLPASEQQQLRGLALPDQVLQKLYHDNAVTLLSKVGVTFGQHL